MTGRKTSSSNYSNQVFLEERCALNELISLLSKRWITEVLFSIEEGNNRFTTLKTELKFISDNILADRLKSLEEHHFISKEVFPEIPSRVEYTLTIVGHELTQLLETLCNFSEQNMNVIASSIKK